MSNFKKVFLAILLAMIFIIPPASMLQNDPSNDPVGPIGDGSVLTNEQGVETTPKSETSDTETDPIDPEEEIDEVNTEGDRSSKKFLDAFKLNFEPFDPEDGEVIDCTATVHNFGTERQIAYNVNVEFWFEDVYIGTDTIDEIQPGENGTASVEWKAVFGSHTMRTIADPDASDGGPDDYEVVLNVTRSEYSPILYLSDNASWIKNSETNEYYIKVTNQGSESDTFDLTLVTKKYGDDIGGWSISLSEDEVSLDGGESTYVTLNVEYTMLDVDYTAEAVIMVMAQSQSDSTRSFSIYTTTDVIHDVPILYVDDDGQHTDQPRMSYSVIGGQYGPETDEINLLALDANYHGLYHHIELEGDVTYSGPPSNQGASGPPYDSSSGISPYTINSKRVYLSDYDIVIWDTGYIETLTASGSAWDRSSETHAWYDQTELMEYMDNGGSFIWLSNKGVEYHDETAGTFNNPLYTDYFNLERCVQQGGLQYRIVGVTQHPVGRGIDVENSFIYSVAGDRSDSLFPKDGAEGIYYSGTSYTTVGYERPRIDQTEQRYKAIVQTTQWSSFGGSYWHYYNDRSPMREQAVKQSMTWLGVPTRIAGEYDLAIDGIESPLGKYVEPNENIPLRVRVKNTGFKDVTQQFSVVFKVMDTDDGNNVVFQKTELVNTDIVAGDVLSVSTSWNSGRPDEGGHYNVTFEIVFGDEDDRYNDNNEAYTLQEGKLVKDMALETANYEKSTFYWNSTRIGDPTEVWCIVINNGSVTGSFDVELLITSPLDTEVYSKTTTVENLAPGEEQRVSWIWFPRNPAGYLTNWHFGVNNRAHRDQYEAEFTITWAEDEDESNNEIGIGSDQAHGIVVMGFCDLSEPRLMAEDWYEQDLSNHDNHGNEIENTPIHLQSNAYVSPTNAWNVGYGDEDGSLSTIKGGWSTVAISPRIDLTNYTEAICNRLYGGLSGSGTLYWEASRDYDGDPEHIESATWTNLISTTGGSGNPYAWWIATGGYTSINQFCGDVIYTRLRWVSDSDGGSCGPFVDEIAIAGIVSQYNSNDLGVTMVTLDPLIAEKENGRDITVTVENFGENKTNSDGRPGFEVQVRIEDDEGIETYKESVFVSDVLGIGDTYTAFFDSGSGKDWVPEENGVYQIFASVIWEQDGNNIDESMNNDVMEIAGVVQRDFFTDDTESGAGNWVVQGEEDGWELGVPEGLVSPTAHSGDNCWATNLDGNYPNLNDNSVTLDHYIDLRTAMDPTLTFWYWLEVEAHDYDTAFVEVRTSEQTKFTTIWQNPSPERQGVPYTSNGWKIATLNLEDFAYHEIYIRFRLQTDGDVDYLGWYIDDIGVGGTTPPQYDARLVTIDYPAEDEYIPPSETIEILATVMNVGLNQDVIPVSATAIRQGASPISYDLGEQSTGVLDPGDKEQVKFTWQLPIGTYQYKIEIQTNLDSDGNPENDVLERYIWAKEVFDISILSLYADPMVQDVARTRQVVAEVQNIGNTELTNNVQITFEAMFEGDKVDEHTIVASLTRGEISPVSWEWQSFKYGSYEINAIGSIVGESDATPVNNEATLGGIITVETIFSDTREEGDSPAYLDRDSGEFKVWDWIGEGVTFWNGDNETNPDSPGWHVVDTGHFSRNSWYGGIPSRDRYSNNMKAELISEALNMDGYTNVHLSFFTKYVIEGRQYDYVDISISNDRDDEDSWVRLLKFPEDHQSHDSSREADSTYGWRHIDRIIPDVYLTETFYIKILMKTDNGITYRGVWIDDITIYGKTTGNHAPAARFSATHDFDNDSYSRHVVQNPPVDFQQIKGNYAFNNLPRPVGSKQGGIQLNTEIHFNADLSFDPDAGDDTLTYKWFFGDGATQNGKAVTYAYTGDLPLEGFFIVTLRVTDENDAFSEDTMLIWIGNKAPEADYIVTSAFDTATPINDENDGVANEVIDVFYGDRIIFQQKSTDAENDFLTYEWIFLCDASKYSTQDVGDTVAGVVGDDFLYEGLDGSEPIIPVTVVDYTVTILVSDGVSVSEMSYTIRVHPYATASFVKKVNLGETILDATVTLTWRGFPEEAAPQASYISPERPVFVHIDETATSPDLNLGNKGGIGEVYEIRSVGCKKQNGEEGFISADISIPILTAELDLIGDVFSLQDDLRLEYYDEVEKRFIAVEDSHVIADGGVKYVEGTVDHFSIYTAIVDSIYNTANPRYPIVLPDISVQKIEFSRSPVQNGQDVEVRAFIKNNGNTHARNVDVKIYDGDDLVGDRRIEIVPASGVDTIIVKESFTVAMMDPDASSEDHRIKVYVNKQRAINEGSQNYKNNEKSELLVVTSVQTTTPSFESTFLMMGISVALVALASTAVMRKTNRRREEE